MLTTTGHDVARVVESTTPIRFRHEEELDRPTVHSSGIAISKKKPTKERRLSVLVGVAAFAAFALLTSTWLFNDTLPAKEPIATQGASQVVTFEVEVSPRNAEVFVGGKVVGKGRFVGQLPVSGETTVVELKAPGYKTERREVVFRKDLTLHTILEPITELTFDREPPTSASAHSAGFSSSTPSSSKDLRSTPKSVTKAVATSAKAARKCNPPYTFSADGVKTYKPECF